MLETWLSKERLLSNSTPRFLTDYEESIEQPSSVRQCSRLLCVGVLGPIINTSVFSELNSKKLFVIQYFISTMHSISFSILCVSPGHEEIQSWVSSAWQWKLTPCFLMIFPKGNMYSIKSNGPSTEPWGTPYCTCDRYDISSFTAKNWWWSDK